MQVLFSSDTSLSREAISTSASTDDDFTTVISKAKKRRVTEERKMIEIQIDIQAAKTVQSTKKLDPPPELANGNHVRPTKKRR